MHGYYLVIMTFSSNNEFYLVIIYGSPYGQ